MNQRVQLVLASQSPARLATLRSAGVEPIVRVSHVDEEQVLAEAATHGELPPQRAVLVLARAKAQEVATHLAGESFSSRCIVVGCDSMLELDSVAYGKPADADDARSRWRKMRGRSGVLRTGHWLTDPSVSPHDAQGPLRSTIGAVSSTRVHFADLDDEEIDAYVATGEPLQVAGAFTVDGLGGPYITGIEGDFHGVVGISLPLLRDLLGSLDIPWRTLRAPHPIVED